MPKSDAFVSLEGYAPVADRILLFYRQYPSGRINTELVSRADGEITFKALLFREPAECYPAATGWASERVGDGEVNTVACLENTETSAIGRALANMGFTASSKRPSREEMEKAGRVRRRLTLAPADGPSGAALQAHADAAHDLLTLLVAAERRGFSARRAGVLRTRANAFPVVPLARVQRIESRLRGWLRRRPV